MALTVNESAPESQPGRTRTEYTVGPTEPHAESGSRASSGAKRHFFFGVTAVWGFTVGVAGALAGLRLDGTPVDLSLSALLGLVVAAGIAIAGARVLAGAYSESKRRRRG